MKGHSVAGALMAVVMVAGAAAAVESDESLYLQLSDASAALAKVNTRLAQANQSTTAPAACVPKQPGYACAAVAKLDEVHARALSALFHVDAIESGGTSAAEARRLDRVAWSAEANAAVFGIISPELAGIISPEYAAIITPGLAGIISPELADDVQLTAGIISPELVGIISPERTFVIEGIISPEYAGLSAAERDELALEVDRIAARAEADLVLAHALRRALATQ